MTFFHFSINSKDSYVYCTNQEGKWNWLYTYHCCDYQFHETIGHEQYWPREAIKVKGTWHSKVLINKLQIYYFIVEQGNEKINFLHNLCKMNYGNEYIAQPSNDTDYHSFYPFAEDHDKIDKNYYIHLYKYNNNPKAYQRINIHI